jgi:hypothetical protein
MTEKQRKDRILDLLTPRMRPEFWRQHKHPGWDFLRMLEELLANEAEWHQQNDHERAALKLVNGGRTD